MKRGKTTWKLLQYKNSYHNCVDYTIHLIYLLIYNYFDHEIEKKNNKKNTHRLYKIIWLWITHT